MTLPFEYQLITGLATGLFLGMMSLGLFWTFLFIVLYEMFVVSFSILYPPEVIFEERLIINLIFIFGWVVSRFLFLRESGFEEIVDSCQYIY